MKTGRLIILALLCALAMTACHHGNGITIAGKSITLHASGVPAATITAQGNLSTGSKAIETTPQQRQMLADYYRSVTTFHQNIEGLRHSGLQMVGTTLGLFAHHLERKVGIASATSAQEKTSTMIVKAKSRQISQTALTMCTSAIHIRKEQAALITQVTSLKPYAGVGKAFQTNCNTSQMAQMKKAMAARASTSAAKP